MSNHARVSGFTMLEVLISMVIIAFGLLGVAGLQAFALKNSTSASQRLTATALANDMIDRIRSNYLGTSDNAAYDQGYNRQNIGDYGGASSCVTPGTICSSNEIAQNDRFEWQTRIARALPNGQGIVCRDSTPNDGTDAGNPGCDDLGAVNFAVKIWWTDDRSSRAAVVPPQVFITAFNP